MKISYKKAIIFSLAMSFVALPVLAAVPATIDQAVPFTSQAPLAEWRDQRQQDGCEEAVAAMAMAWVGKEKNITKENWRLRILILSNFEYKKYGEYRDVSLRDIVAWLFKDYFNYQKVSVKPVKDASDIIKELEAGHLVLLPMDGQKLKNPYFSPPGPERHMILVRGYDYAKDQFITNDPGTRRGAAYRYSSTTIFQAIRAYQTGYHQPIKEVVKEMIVVEK